MARERSGNQASYLIILVIVLAVAVIYLVMKNQSDLQGALVISPEEERVLGCQDLEPNNDPYLKGYVQVGKRRYYDSCFQKTVKQYACGRDLQATLTRDFRCASGCNDGACKR